MGQLVVGVSLSLPDTGGARAMQQTYMSTHGMTTANTTVLVDGQMTNGLQGDGAIQSYYNDAMNAEDELPDGRHRRRDLVGRRPPEHDSARRRQPLQRRLQGRVSRPGQLAVEQPDRSPPGRGPDRRQRHRSHHRLHRRRSAARSRRTSCGSSPRRATSRSTTSSPTRSWTTAARALTISSSRTAWRALTWQASPRNKISAYFDEIDKYRGHDMQSNYDPETAATVWNSPAYHTTAIKWTSPVTSSLFLEAGFSNNTEYYTNEYREGIEKPRGSAPSGSRNAAEERGRPRRLHAGRSDQHHREPDGVLLERGGDAGSRATTPSSSAPTTGRARSSTPRLANADLVQQYRSTQPPACAGRVPDIGADPQLRRCHYGERLNRDLGIYIQDSWRLNRLTANIGLRWETLNAQVNGRQVAGRPLRAGADVRRDQGRAGLERLRAAHGAGLRPVRQRPDRDQVLAEPLQPVAHDRHRRQLQPAADRRRRRCRGATSTATTSPTARCAARLPERRLRNRLRQPVGQLRHRRAERVRRIPAHLEPRVGTRGPARAVRRPLGQRRRGGRATSTT